MQPNQPVELRIAKRINENYVPPPQGAFSGSGNRLGAPVPGDSGAASSSSTAPVASTSVAAPAESEGGASITSIQPRFSVDQDKPTTSVQVRLADGTRIVVRMNHDHTVLDLRNFINAYVPFLLVYATIHSNITLVRDQRT